MRTFSRTNHCSLRAFTLIEVALAIAILGIGLATITTLSTRLVDDTFYEVGRSRGTILALYILETQAVSPADATNDEDNGSQNQAGALIPKLETLGYFSGLNRQEDFPYLDERWTYELNFEPLALPLSEKTYNIVTSAVRWGPSDFETVHLQSIVEVKTNNNSTSAGGIGTNGTNNTNGLSP